MTFSDELDEFFSDEKKMLVSDPLRFKRQLGIGQKAYGSLRKRENLRTFVEALSVGGIASAAAGSKVVAGTFFAKTGLLSGALSGIGLGAAAVTPIGWVLASGVVFGGAYAAASTLLERNKETGLIVVPKYINTPLDVIAVALLDLMLPVSLKVATSDGQLCEKERGTIKRYFVETWGYSSAYVGKRITEFEERLEGLTYEPLATALSNYCEVSPDCDRHTIVSSFLLHLEDIVFAKGGAEHQQLVELILVRRLLCGEIDCRNDPGWYARTRRRIEDGIKASTSGWESLLPGTQKLGRVVPEGIGFVSSAWARVAHGVERAVGFGRQAGKQVTKKAKRTVDKTAPGKKGVGDE